MFDNNLPRISKQDDMYYTIKLHVNIIISGVHLLYDLNVEIWDSIIYFTEKVISN